MKKNIVALVMLCSSVVALGMSAPARAEMGKSVVGPSLLFGNNGGGTAFGIDSKFGISENLSVRPAIYFPNGGTIFGAGLTYDFDLGRNSKTPITPFLGGNLAFISGNNGGSATVVSFTGGADFSVSDTIDLKAAINVPISGNNFGTYFSIGGGFKF
jgi:hypothetical protein